MARIIGAPAPEKQAAVVVWLVVATCSPRVHRHCSRCGKPQPFASSGKFRINAQKRRLDVWLVYRCANCEQTWNVAVHERVTPEALGSERLDAYLTNSPTTPPRQPA